MTYNEVLLMLKKEVERTLMEAYNEGYKEGYKEAEKKVKRATGNTNG